MGINKNLAHQVGDQPKVNVLYVNKQEFSASSWRSNQGKCIICE